MGVRCEALIDLIDLRRSLQYQEEIDALNQVARHRPRSSLVLGIQQENRQIRDLQQENQGRSRMESRRGRRAGRGMGICLGNALLVRLWRWELCWQLDPPSYDERQERQRRLERPTLSNNRGRGAKLWKNPNHDYSNDCF